MNGTLRVAVPNKGTLSEPAADILSEAGYRRRSDPKDLTVIDPVNNVEFFFLRPRTLPSMSGRDSWIWVSRAVISPRSPTRPCVNGSPWASARRRSATRRRPGGVARRGPRGQADCHSVSPSGAKRLGGRGIDATVIRLDGAVEISVQLGVADAIADVVGSGRTLGLHDLVAFGEPLCDSEAVLIERENPSDENAAARDQLAGRVQGVVFGQQYLMLDYDCPRSVLDDATAVTPGLESPTIAPLADPAWVAVRALVPRRDVNAIMDELAAIGAKAILASDIRFCRF
jgi:ATP phosphoribosyltransferase